MTAHTHAHTESMDGGRGIGSATRCRHDAVRGVSWRERPCVQREGRASLTREFPITLRVAVASTVGLVSAVRAIGRWRRIDVLQLALPRSMSLWCQTQKHLNGHRYQALAPPPSPCSSSRLPLIELWLGSALRLMRVGRILLCDLFTRKDSLPHLPL